MQVVGFSQVGRKFFFKKCDYLVWIVEVVEPVVGLPVLTVEGLVRKLEVVELASVLVRAEHC